MSEKYNMEKVKATVHEVMNTEFTDADKHSLIIAVSTEDKTALFTHASQSGKMQIVTRIIQGMLGDEDSPYPPHVLAMLILASLSEAMQEMLKPPASAAEGDKPMDIDAKPPVDVDALTMPDDVPPAIN